MRPSQESGNVFLETIQESEDTSEALLDFSDHTLKSALLMNKLDKREGAVAPIELTPDEGTLALSALNAACVHPATEPSLKERIQNMLDGYDGHLA